MDTEALGFVRDNNDQIGAFVITNESGVNYHYALPAYSREEFVKSEKIDQSGGQSFNTLDKPEKYAYTWYLTAVTGPDYVDRNDDGRVDEGDWGYWVGFDYGLWTQDYIWRNPATGYHEDLDREFRNYSKGKKELYYLNTIRTATHTALFVKDVRPDGKGVSTYKGDIGQFSVNYSGTTDEADDVPCIKYPTSTMKLASIYLFKNEQFKAFGNIPASSDRYGGEITCSGWSAIKNKQVVEKTYYHRGYNVVDVHDVEAITSQLNNSTLRKIRFHTDYSLADRTRNSFLTFLETEDPNYPRGFRGKLTLKAVEFLGKRGQGAIPPVQFNYDFPPARTSEITLQKTGDDYTIYDSGDKFKAGDIITFGSFPHYFLLSEKLSNKNYQALPLSAYNGSSSITIQAARTKNPPYMKDHYDVWNMYKSDYTGSAQNDNIDRVTSLLSAQNSDVWSLRQIETSLGAMIDIDYETDSYHESVLQRNNALLIESFSNISDEVKTIHVKTNGVDLRNIFEEGNGIDLVVLYKAIQTNFNSSGEYSYTSYRAIDTSEDEAMMPVIENVGNNYLNVRSKPLWDFLYKRQWNQNNCYCAIDPTPIGGNLSFNNTIETVGGGIRVQQITTTEPVSGNRYITSYKYFLPDGKTSSGVTAYEPVGLNKYEKYGLTEDQLRNFKDKLYRGFSDVLANAREAPGPGVMYEYVTVKESVHHPGEAEPRPVPGYNRYHFQVFDKGMVGVDYASADTTVHAARNYFGLNYDQTTTRQVTLKDHTTRIGELRGVTRFGPDGHRLSETINHYLHDEVVQKMTEDPGVHTLLEANTSFYEPEVATRFNNQGVIHEGFLDGRVVSRGLNRYGLLAIASRRESFPVIQTGTTNIDYQTGISTTTMNLAYDFYSGVPTKTLHTDAHGNKFGVEVIPAYHAYAQMGLKTTDTNNKHMLTQQAAQYTFKVNDNYETHPNALNTLGVVSGEVQTWSDQIPVDGEGIQLGIWRKHRNYAFTGNDNLNPDGTSPHISEFVAWEHGHEPPANSLWELQSEVTRVDPFSHALEIRDLNNQYSATKMDNTQAYIYASAINADYNEFAYSGAEDTPVTVNGTRYFGGGVELVGGTHGSTISHTGHNSLKTTGSEKGFRYTAKAGRTYRASVWTNSPSGVLQYKTSTGTVSTVAADPGKQVNGWYLVTATIGANAEDVTIWCNGTGSGTKYYDDFRVHPVDAPMTSYVYNQWGELSHILDGNNLYTQYQYDANGRLTATLRETLRYGVKRTSDIQYNHAQKFEISPAEFHVEAEGGCYPVSWNSTG